MVCNEVISSKDDKVLWWDNRPVDKVNTLDEDYLVSSRCNVSDDLRETSVIDVQRKNKKSVEF